jgi:hypothetical protein
MVLPQGFFDEAVKGEMMYNCDWVNAIKSSFSFS